MRKYISAVEAADKLSKCLDIPMVDLVDIMSEIPAADVAEGQHGRWVSCGERLPELFKNNLGIEYSETVFALTNGRKIMAAFLRRVPGDKAIWIAPFDFWEAWDEEITHWTEFPPLPGPPEEGVPGNDEISDF